MTPSLCEACAWMREVVTPKGSRFLLCQSSKTDPDYPKYPQQPVVRCEGYRKKDDSPLDLREDGRHRLAL